MIELLIQSFGWALFIVFIIGGCVGSFFLNLFKKENPKTTYYGYIEKEQNKYWKKK